MDPLARAIGTVINKYPQRGFTVADLKQVSGLPAAALVGILDNLVKDHLVRREVTETGTTYWAIASDPNHTPLKKDSTEPPEEKGSTLAAGATAGLVTAALAALIAELGS
ncbi:hypothetical protein ACFSJ3_04745 [Corallincola platygyrae]|uniref:MarR family transcriptional regulator n=1 Tax=Corallincola platygyrae TaxID=1193278 RepID=A0ABW4XMN7_9GAMM